MTVFFPRLSPPISAPPKHKPPPPAKAGSSTEMVSVCLYVCMSVCLSICLSVSDFLSDDFVVPFFYSEAVTPQKHSEIAHTDLFSVCSLEKLRKKDEYCS